jgi:hypothetical protein
MKRKNITRAASFTIAILLIPLIAMQFTEEVQWNAFDFVVMGTLLFGMGMIFEIAANYSSNISYRLASSIAVLTSLALIWVNLAVGFIGDESFEANLLFAGVLAIGGIGAIISRLRAQGMANTLFAMAFAQLSVPVITLIFWESAFTLEMVQVFTLNTFFIVLFLSSALLFQRAQRSN